MPAKPPSGGAAPPRAPAALPERPQRRTCYPNLSAARNGPPAQLDDAWGPKHDVPITASPFAPLTPDELRDVESWGGGDL